MNSPLAENTPPTATPRSRRDFWCHQCSAEITPMMVPHPLCPECHSEFVEKIEEDNDPRSFVEAGHGHGDDDDDDEDGHEAQETMSLEDLLRVIQLLSNVPRSTPSLRSQQRQQQRQQQLGHLPGGYPTGTGTGAAASNPFTLFDSIQSARSGSGTTAAARTSSTAAVLDDEDEEMLEVMDDTEPTQQQPQGAPTSIASLLERIGLELQFMNEGGQPSLGGFGGLFNMVGNPGDYVFGQGGLDDVITQMMEMHSRQNGPVALSDEAINELPHHALTSEELDAKTDCSVCKDEFERQDNCIQLKCKHIFHEDCIKPWLKTSATCPTCRFSLVPDEQQQEQQSSSNYSSSTSLPGSFPRSSASPGDSLD